MQKELNKDRYLVLKWSDILLSLDAYERSALYNTINKINALRAEKGKQEWNGICIRDTWPEYEEVKNKVLDRISRWDAAESWLE